MNYEDTSTRGPSFLPQIARIADAAVRGAGVGVSKLRKGTSRFFTAMQVARMESVLNSFSDKQLEMIELKRSDIRRHAEHLVNYRYDGL